MWPMGLDMRFFVANFVKFLRAFYALAQTYRDFHGLLGIRPTQGHTTLSERIQTNMSFFLFFLYVSWHRNRVATY